MHNPGPPGVGSETNQDFRSYVPMDNAKGCEVFCISASFSLWSLEGIVL